MTLYGYAPNAHCERCRGYGLLHPVTDSGRLIFNKTVMCPAPGCLADSFRNRQTGQATLPKGTSKRQMTFENFRYTAKAKHIYQAFKDLAESKADYVMLLVYGGTGNGKTHLCNALVRRLHEKGIPTQTYAVADMFSEMRQRINDNTLEDLIERLKTVDALVLDDYGVEKQTDWAVARVEEIIDARYREMLLTVLTTNRGLEVLPERVVSRFNEPGVGKVLLNDLPDFRMRG